MRDAYLYEDCDVLKNLLGIKDKELLDEAEAGYVTYRLKEIALTPLEGEYDYEHMLKMHKYIFQDIYEWAGQQRKLNIYKEREDFMMDLFGIKTTSQETEDYWDE